MAASVAIRNKTAVEQYVIKDGRREGLGAFQTRIVNRELAEMFVTQRPSYIVMEEVQVGQIDTSAIQGDVRWIYNSTGNPDLVPTVQVYNEKKREYELVPNPKIEGRVIRRSMGGGQETILIKGQPIARALATKEYVVYPWQRKPLPKGVADWMLQRDALQGDLFRGSLKWSRPPSGFEPTPENIDSWSLDDLQIYTAIVDSKCPVGPTEDDLRKAREAGRYSEIEAALGNKGYQTKTFDAIVAEAKDLLFKRLFFRLADPLFPLPTQEDFYAVKKSVLAERGEQKVAEKDPFKRGRKREEYQPDAP